MPEVSLHKRDFLDLSDKDLELPGPSQEIVQVQKRIGRGLHEVEEAYGDEKFYVFVRSKFNRRAYLKPGDFMVIERFAPTKSNVKGEMIKQISKAVRAHYEAAGIWPEKFAKKTAEEEEEESTTDDEDSDKFVMRNPNRSPSFFYDSSDDSDSDDEDGSDDEDPDETSDSGNEEGNGESGSNDKSDTSDAV